MRFVDVAPFVAVLIIGFAAGRLLPGRWPWACLVFPAAHLFVSIASGRAGDDLWSYVIPINAILAALTVGGMFVGRLRRRNLYK